jgi:L-fuculose-phosphate aldolase
MHCLGRNSEVTFGLLKMATDHQFRRDIIRCGSLLHTCGFIAATDGNISVRLDDERVLVTPTGMSKGMMKTSDLVIVDMNGHKLKGKREVTSEIGMHLLIYRMRPDVNAVVHAHPRTATGFAASGIALNKPLVCEVVIGLGQIPLAPYGTPGTQELAETLEPLIPDFDAILMANHGVVTYGSDLQSAYMKMETVEHFAQITLVTHLLGKQRPLDSSNLEKLIAVRSRYLGVTSGPRMPVHFVDPVEEDADDLVEEPVGEGKSFRERAIHHRRGSGLRRGN